MASFLPDFEEVDTEPLPCTILPARPKLKQPAFVVMVNRIDDEEYARLRGPLTRVIAKNLNRPDSPLVETATEEFRERYVRKVFAGWSGATVRNLNDILARNNKKVGPAMRKSIDEAGGEAPFSPELAVSLIKMCRADDFDVKIAEVANFGIQQAAEEREGKDGASPTP